MFNFECPECDRLLEWEDLGYGHDCEENEEVEEH